MFTYLVQLVAIVLYVLLSVLLMRLGVVLRVKEGILVVNVLEANIQKDMVERKGKREREKKKFR